jgi:protein-S-isoprenylcysteine O-methyltransferase Ste14
LALLPLITQPFYALIFYIIVAIWLGLEVVIGRRKNVQVGGKVRDKSSRGAVIGSIYATLFLGFAFAFAVPALQIPYFRVSIFVLGCALMIFGIAFRLYSIRVLGKYFTYTVSISSGQKVIQNGPYRFIRHPSYTGSIITCLGDLIALTSFLALLAIIPALIGYWYRIRIEEEALSNELGEDYKAYMKKTKRLIPFVV